MKRSKWKGPFLKKSNLTEKFVVLPRNYEITSKIVGLTCNVHSGRIFIKLNITDEMIGHKIGEFIPTRERFVFKKKKKELEIKWGKKLTRQSLDLVLTKLGRRNFLKKKIMNYLYIFLKI